MVYEKFRSTYQLAGAEVVLDEMPYGNFIEIEGAPAAIEVCVTQLGLSQHERILASYVDLFNIVKTALGLDFRDLSFTNFEGIAVPGHLLT
jgi:adenylate cyclase class 2